MESSWESDETHRLVGSIFSEFFGIECTPDDLQTISLRISEKLGLRAWIDSESHRFVFCLEAGCLSGPDVDALGISLLQMNHLAAVTDGMTYGVDEESGLLTISCTLFLRDVSSSLRQRLAEGLQLAGIWEGVTRPIGKVRQNSASESPHPLMSRSAGILA